MNLDDYLVRGQMTAGQVLDLRDQIRKSKNILVIGGAGTGKTTMANVVLHEMTFGFDPHDSFVVIEDVPELFSPAPNSVYLRSDSENSQADLVRSMSRIRSNHLVVGELRGAEAYALVRHWSTGCNGGLTTMNATDFESGMRRFVRLVAEHAPSDLVPNSVPYFRGCVVLMECDDNVPGRVREIYTV